MVEAAGRSNHEVSIDVDKPASLPYKRTLSTQDGVGSEGVSAKGVMGLMI